MELLESWESSHESEVQVETFLKKMRPKLYRVLAQYRVPPTDSEDVVQQALLALVYGWGEIHDPEPWLIGTLRNKCLLYWRQRRRRLYEAMDVVLLEWISEGSRPDQDRVEFAHDLEILLSHIPDRSRRLLTLRYCEGYSSAELAKELGYSRKSISKLISRSLGILSRELVRSGRSPTTFRQTMAPPS